METFKELFKWFVWTAILSGVALAVVNVLLMLIREVIDSFKALL